MIMCATFFQTSYFVDVATVCPGNLSRSPEASGPVVLYIVSWPLAPSRCYKPAVLIIIKGIIK